MTNAGPIILILVAVAIGYVIEPIFIADKKKPDTEKVTDDTVEDKSPDVVPEPTEPDVQIDLSKITPEDFPEEVSLKVPFSITDASSGVTMNLKAGAKVKPLRLEGTELTIQPIGFPVEGKTHVNQTDFASLAAPKMIARLSNKVAQNDPPVADPEPDPMPDPEPEPKSDPEPEPEPVAKKLDKPTIIKLMKQSVADGKVTEFKADQVTEWKAGKEMEFDGEQYQSGIVTFKAETILGVQEHDAIVLFKDGAVHKWMWAKTKLEMR